MYMYDKNFTTSQSKDASISGKLLTNAWSNWFPGGNACESLDDCLCIRPSIKNCLLFSYLSMKFGLGSLLSEVWAVSFILFPRFTSGRVRWWCWLTFGAGVLHFLIVVGQPWAPCACSWCGGAGGHNVSLDYHLSFILPLSTDWNSVSKSRTNQININGINLTWVTAERR